MENNIKQEELDMLYIFRNIKAGFFNLFKRLNWLIGFSIKKTGVLLLFISVTVAICVGLQTLQKPYYSSFMALSHIRFDNDYCATAVNNLNAFIVGSKDNSELAKELSLAPDQAKLVKRIAYSPLNERMAEQYADSLDVFLPFKIEVEVYDNAVLDTLQYKLLNYLENNNYAAKRKQLDRVTLDRIETKLKEEMLETDSLKNLVNQSIVPRSSGNGLIVGEPIDPVTVYKRGMDLYERNLQLNEKQALNDSFEVIIGFIKRPKSSSAGLPAYIIVGILVGYVIGISWLVRKEYRKKDPAATA